MGVELDKHGPWALILGGSEGVGAEFARELAQDGFDLVLVARKPGPLAEAAAMVAALGRQVRTVAVDLTEADALPAIAAVTDDIEIGLLIFNAGANTNHGAFMESDPASVQRVIDLNITAPLALARHFGAPMKERGRGGMIFVGSLAGYMGQPEISVYSGAKAFGRIFMEGLWLELAAYGVDVQELVLGVTRTPAMERLGLRFDLPGLNVGEPVEIAREGLAALGSGPLHVAGGNAELAEKRNGMDRAAIVSGAHAQSRKLIAMD